MKEKFLELLRRDDIQDKIKDLYCKLDKNRFLEGTGSSGWGWKIILDKDGNVDFMYNSNNTSRMDVFNGDAIEVVYLEDNAEVMIESLGDIESIEDYNEFKVWLGEQFDLHENTDESDEEYKEKKEEYIEEHTNWMDYYDFNLNGFQKAEAEAWEAICDDCSYNAISEKLHYLIEDLDRQVNGYY